MLAMFQGFRRLPEAISALTSALEDLAKIQRELGPARDRLDSLELHRHHFEAEMQAAVLKAESQYKAANASESRERQLKKANERLTDTFSDEGEATEGAGTAVAVNPDAGEGPPEGVSPLHLVLAPNDKAHAVRTKWGIA